MKNRKLTLPSVLLTAMCCVSIVQTTYAQLPPRMVAYTEYQFENDTFAATDSTYFKYDQPNAYNQRLKQWLPGIKGSFYVDFMTGALTNPVDSTIYAYDANGNNTAIVRMRYAVTWDTAQQTYYAYNGNKQVVKMTEIDYNGTFETVYSYNGQNNLTEIREGIVDVSTGIKTDFRRELFAYSGGLRTSETYDDWRNNQWEPDRRVLYTYKSGLVDSIWYENYNETVSRYQKHLLQIKHFNASNDLDTMMVYAPDVNMVWGPADRRIYSYNNKRQLVQDMMQYKSSSGAWEYQSSDSIYYNVDDLPSLKISGQIWNNASGNFENENRKTKQVIYYYETPTHIADKSNRTDKIIIFPNPASMELTIRFDNIKGNPFSVTIYDAMGKAVRHWNKVAGSRNVKTLDVADLATGHYLLRISSDVEVCRPIVIIH